jgi:hypothetical protein
MMGFANARSLSGQCPLMMELPEGVPVLIGPMPVDDEDAQDLCCLHLCKKGHFCAKKTHFFWRDVIKPQRLVTLITGFSELEERIVLRRLDIKFINFISSNGMLRQGQ